MQKLCSQCRNEKFTIYLYCWVIPYSIACQYVLQSKPSYRASPLTEQVQVQSHSQGYFGTGATKKNTSFINFLLWACAKLWQKTSKMLDYKSNHIEINKILTPRGWLEPGTINSTFTNDDSEFAAVVTRANPGWSGLADHAQSSYIGETRVEIAW